MFNLFDAQVVIFSSLFLQHISDDWVKLHSVFLCLILLSFMISLALPESPKFLVSRKEYEKAMDAYNTVARLNNHSEKVLRREVHRFKEEKRADKKALRKHFKIT